MASATVEAVHNTAPLSDWQVSAPLSAGSRPVRRSVSGDAIIRPVTKDDNGWPRWTR